jgi:hypothetical protein
MRKGWLLLLGAGLALVGMCLWCLWFSGEQPRFSQEFDLGDGRKLRVWSTRSDKWFEPHPLLVFYRVDQRGKELVPTTFLEHDDGGEYQFNVVYADGGRLACVYEITRATLNSYYLLIFDAGSGESWPRLRDNETNSHPGVMDKWRDRYRRLKAENPDLPTPDGFKEK